MRRQRRDVTASAVRDYENKRVELVATTEAAEGTLARTIQAQEHQVALAVLGGVRIGSGETVALRTSSMAMVALAVFRA